MCTTAKQTEWGTPHFLVTHVYRPVMQRIGRLWVVGDGTSSCLLMVVDLRLSPWVLKYKLSYLIEDQISSCSRSTIIVRMCFGPFSHMPFKFVKQRPGPIRYREYLRWGRGALLKRVVGHHSNSKMIACIREI